MPITIDDLKKELEQIDKMSLEDKIKKYPGEFCSCGQPLEETPGERYFMQIKNKKTQVCSDCYYDEIGKEIDRTGYLGVPHKHGLRGQANLD